MNGTPAKGLMDESQCPSIFQPQDDSSEKSADLQEGKDEKNLSAFWLLKILSKREWCLIILAIILALLEGIGIPHFGVLIYTDLLPIVDGLGFDDRMELIFWLFLGMGIVGGILHGLGVS